jgi:hypothetical protein
MPMQSLAEAITEIPIASRKPLLARDIADQQRGAQVVTWRAATGARPPRRW